MDVREVIAKKLREENHIDAKSSEIVVSTGAKQCLFNVLLATLNKGDDVLIVSPYWVSYPPMVDLAGARVRYLPTRIEEGYKINPKDLDKALRSDTRMLILSTPCNPTGAVLGKSLMQDVVDVLKAYPNVLVISDEIYEHIIFAGKHHSLGSYASLGGRVITINGLSKSFAMTGWRLGYMHASEAVARACEKIQGQSTSGANALAQRAVIEALGNKDIAKQACAAMCQAYLRRRDAVLKAFEANPGALTYTPEGAYYLFPDMSYHIGKSTGKHTIQNINDLCLYILKAAGVA